MKRLVKKVGIEKILNTGTTIQYRTLKAYSEIIKMREEGLTLKYINEEISDREYGEKIGGTEATIGNIINRFYGNINSLFEYYNKARNVGHYICRGVEISKSRELERNSRTASNCDFTAFDNISDNKFIKVFSEAIDKERYILMKEIEYVIRDEDKSSRNDLLDLIRTSSTDMADNECIDILNNYISEIIASKVREKLRDTILNTLTLEVKDIMSCISNTDKHNVISINKEKIIAKLIKPKLLDDE